MTAQMFHHHRPDREKIVGSCPFFDSAHASCQAAMLAFVPDGRCLYNYCCSDDYDACALFLAKALRSSSGGRFDRDVAVRCEK